MEANNNPTVSRIVRINCGLTTQTEPPLRQKVKLHSSCAQSAEAVGSSAWLGDVSVPVGNVIARRRTRKMIAPSGIAQPSTHGAYGDPRSALAPKRCIDIGWTSKCPLVQF